MTRTYSAILFAFAWVTLASAWTKDGTVYTTDGSQADVMAAESNSSQGDTILVPAGTFEWGAGFVAVNLNKSQTLQGAGQGQTIINLVTSGPNGVYGAIQFYSAARVTGMTINGSAANNASPFAAQNSASGWRIDHVTYDATKGGTVVDDGYFIYVSGGTGLIDNCTIIGSAGNNELIFPRGATNAWQTAATMGTATAVYVEDCTFSGQGYVCDANSNSKMVLRYNTITSNMKIDAHGVASNSPPRSARHMEIYGNTWTSTTYTIELRGGTGVVWGNTSNTAWWILHEYGCTALWPNFGSQYQTPYDYPIADQIGVGMDPRVGGSEPYYLWSNTNGGGLMALTWKAVPQGAIDRYRTQTGNAEATFTMQDVIAADRDYFMHAASFNGTTGVGVGTKAQMNAITPTKAGVGFWVTDEADWNANSAGNDGQLYTWNGSAWVLKYTPYTYPHPLRNAVAVPVITLDPVSLTREEGLSATFSISATGNPTPTYQWKKGGVNISGATSSSYTIPAVVEADEGTYTCVATNSQGSDTSAGATLTVNPAGTAPSNPTSVTLEAQGNRGFRIAWTDAASNEIRYDIQWRVGAGSWTEVQYAPGTTSATILTATPGQVLEAQVRVVGSEGAGSWVAATPTTVTMPAASPVRRSKNGGAVRAGGGL